MRSWELSHSFFSKLVDFLLKFIITCLKKQLIIHISFIFIFAGIFKSWNIIFSSFDWMALKGCSREKNDNFHNFHCNPQSRYPKIVWNLVKQVHHWFLEHWNSRKSLCNIWQLFSCLLDEGISKIWKKLILKMAFWVTCKIAQPIQPIWQHIFDLPYSALKKPQWEFNFFHIFGIPSSSRHEKCCQILQTLFLGISIL